MFNRYIGSRVDKIGIRFVEKNQTFLFCLKPENSEFKSLIELAVKVRLLVSGRPLAGVLWSAMLYGLSFVV